MEEVEVLKKDYWSKSDAFILPLTGLVRDMKYIARSYFFWESYSIENYQLIVKFFHKNGDLFARYCKDYIYPVLNKGSYLIETYDCDDGEIMVLDMSEWGEDIDMILQGKYSKMSDEAKAIIKKYHKNKQGEVPIYIYAVLYPFRDIDILGNMTSIDYVAKTYGLVLDDLKKIGELGRIYDKDNETLKESCNAVS